MAANLDILIEFEHPNSEALEAVSTKLGGTPTLCTPGGWANALAIGKAEWVAFVEQHVAISPAEILQIAEKLAPGSAPIQIQAPATAATADRFVWEACPPQIAICWNNPLRFAALIVERSQLPNLPLLEASHLEFVWDWLTRATLQAGAVSWISLLQPAPQPAWTWRPSAKLPALTLTAPDSRVTWLVELISRLKPSQLVPEKSSEADAVAVKAGLLQWHGALDASHQLAQSVEGLGAHQSGDYWHAIMHRREPDYANAKYWFRQLKTHSVFAELAPHALTILDSVAGSASWKDRLSGKGSWDPLAFVDLCEACAGHEETPLGTAARHIQAAEMQLLMAATYRDASGHSR